MVSLPMTGHTPVIRTDFSSPAAWEAARAAILAPGAEAAMFTAQVHFVDDPDFAGYTPARILALVTDEFADRHACLFIADETTVNTADWPALVMDLRGERGRMFRTVADEMYGIEANLSIGNMDFSFYAESAQETGGVFRGGGPSRSVINAGLQQALQNSPGNAMAAMLKPGKPPVR
jgi:hypothetical protein